MAFKLDEKALDRIIDEMVKVVEDSKDEVFNISEEARKEHEYLVVELRETKDEVARHINLGGKLEKELRHSKNRLAEVSKDFNRYTEDEIHDIYNETHAMQTNLAMLRKEEQLLRKKRDDLERRLISLSQTIERAEGLVSKITVILNYLLEDFQQVNEIIDDAKQKQEFGLKIIEAQEEQRKKISREIHDGPAQMLANLLLRSEIVDKTFRNGDMDEALGEIKNIRSSIRSSLYEVRRIIYDLRPMALDDLGLIPTIRKYVNTISEYEHIPVDFKIIAQEKRLDQQYEIAFFRMVQEALQNATKHAEATYILVKLEILRQGITMIVKDNGKGFDPKQKKDKSFGLIGMRERVEMLDGKLTIDSQPGKGTTISIYVPTV